MQCQWNYAKSIGIKKASDPEEESLGLYFHVPFVHPCDFYILSEETKQKGKRTLFSCLKKEISSISADRLVSSVFVGGGTPGLFLNEN